MHVHAPAFESDVSLVAILAGDSSVFPARLGCPTDVAWSRDVTLGWDQELKDPNLTVE